MIFMKEILLKQIIIMNESQENVEITPLIPSVVGVKYIREDKNKRLRRYKLS